MAGLEWNQDSDKAPTNTLLVGVFVKSNIQRATSDKVEKYWRSLNSPYPHHHCFYAN